MWMKLGEQVLNSALLAAPVALSLLVWDRGAVDWRPIITTFGLVFVTKMAVFRGLNGK